MADHGFKVTQGQPLIDADDDVKRGIGKPCGSR